MPRNLAPSAQHHTGKNGGRRPCPLNPDRTFYSVVCHLKGETYARETDLADMEFDRIAKDISDGQIEEVIKVFAFNPAEGWVNDVTSDILAAAFPEEDGEGGPDVDDIGNVQDGWDDPCDYTSERLGPFEGGCGRWAA